jgi:transposase
MVTAVRQRCAGIDMHRDFVMVCRMWGATEGEAHGEIRRFDSTVPGLEELPARLSAEQCQDVVLESTGP